MADFTITKGDSVSFNIVVTSGGVAFNLTGATIWMTAKLAFGDPDSSAIFQKKTGSGIVITNPANGAATITLAATDTSPLPAFKTLLLYDIQVKDQQGGIYTVASGNLIVLPDVTLATS